MGCWEGEGEGGMRRQATREMRSKGSNLEVPCATQEKCVHFPLGSCRGGAPRIPSATGRGAHPVGVVVLSWARLDTRAPREEGHQLCVEGAEEG